MRPVALRLFFAYLKILHQGRANAAIAGVIFDAVHGADQMDAGNALVGFTRALGDKRLDANRGLRFALMLDADLQPVVKIFDGHVQAIPISVEQRQRLATKILQGGGQPVASGALHAHAFGKMGNGSAHGGDQAIIAGKMQNRARMFTRHCG